MKSSKVNDLSPKDRWILMGFVAVGVAIAAERLSYAASQLLALGDLPYTTVFLSCFAFILAGAYVAPKRRLAAKWLAGVYGVFAIASMITAKVNLIWEMATLIAAMVIAFSTVHYGLPDSEEQSIQLI